MPRSVAVVDVAAIGQSAATTLLVGLGEARTLTARAGLIESLVVYGLGSCVALCVWDPTSGVAGMAHVVMPGLDPNGGSNPRYARSALPALLSLMQAQGASPDPHRWVARLTGGANILALEVARGVVRVGDANARAVQAVLGEAGVSIVAQDLGGSIGRSVWFAPRDGGRIRVRTIGGADRYL